MKSRIVLVVAAACFCVNALAAGYSIKGPALPNTSNRDSIAFADFPLEQPWEQFSVADMRQLRSQYAVLADNEEPPFPQEGMKPIIDKLRAAQKRSSIEGDLFAVVTVDERGNARDVAFLETPAVGDLNAISGILAAAKYKPAKCGGVECAMEFPLHITFKLNHSIVF